MDSLLSLFKAEPFKKEYEINGVKVTLRMLSRKEYDDVMSRANISADDIVSKEALIRRPVLGYALQEINGVNVKDLKEVKSVLEKNQNIPINIVVEQVLGDFDAFFIDALYGLYNTLVEDDEKNRAELKKD
jgi:hypothetical protein